MALQRLLEEDDGRDHRQVGIVDIDGQAASHTGAECLDWAGGVTGDGYAIQGNILAGAEVVAAMEAAFLASDPEHALAQRLMAALRAGDEAGGDARGRQSAALLVVRDEAGFDGRDDIEVDLRIDDHTSPIDELERLLALHDHLNAGVPEDERTPDTAGPARPRWTAEREPWEDSSFAVWVGINNYENLGGDGLDGDPARGGAPGSHTGLAGATHEHPGDRCRYDRGDRRRRHHGRSHRGQGLPGVPPALPQARLGRALGGGDLAGHHRGDA